MTVYRIVQSVDGRLVASDVQPENLMAWLDVRGFEVVGVNTNHRQHAELQGQPVIDRFVGPMRDGPGVIRYEDEEANDRISA